MRQQLPALTGLRFVAACMVFVLHSLPNPGHWLVLDQGVSFFFVLSGFILSYVYPALPDALAIKRFYVARLARLWPLHLLTALLAVALYGKQPFDAMMLNITLLQAWVPIQSVYFSGNAVSWSLSTEAFFCLVFPWLITGVKANYLWKLAGSAAVVVTMIIVCTWLDVPLFSADSTSAHGLLYINPITRIFEFIAGVGCWLVWCRTQPYAANWPAWAFTIAEALAVMLVAALMIYPFSFAHPALGAAGTLWMVRTSALLGFCAIVAVFAFGRGLFSQLMASRPFEFLGEISFAIYLVHLLVITEYSRRIKDGLLLSAPENFVLTAGITLIAAAVLHILIEKPLRSGITRVFAETRPRSSGRLNP